MNWDRVIRAIDGDRRSLARLARKEWHAAEESTCAALLLIEEAPHAAAATVVAGIAARRGHGAPIVTALASSAARGLAAWRCDPTWADCCIGRGARTSVIWEMASLVAVFRHDPAALRDAVGIVARDGDDDAVARCLASLDLDGWSALDNATRDALHARALQSDPAALGSVWSGLAAAQRASAVQRVASDSYRAAELIGRIGAAWRETDAALRARLIATASQHAPSAYCSAPAWMFMDDAERNALTTATIADGVPLRAYRLLESLGCDGRRTLSPAQRAALDACAARQDAWRTALLRVVDDGWNGVNDADRQTLMAATSDAWNSSALIRAVGGDGWASLPLDAQAALRAAVQRTIDSLFSLPPALWIDGAGSLPLPPATSAGAFAMTQWRAEDADADLRHLPATHQALVLALAPWRDVDCVPSAPRMQRLLAAWNDMTPDARVDLANAHPWTLAVVAAAARLTADARTIDAVVAAVGGIVGRSDGRTTGMMDVLRLLNATRRLRSWMRAFAPTDADPPEAWDAWIRAARRGAILDRGIVLRLMASGAPLRASRRAQR